ncbi:MAG: hypothetical protein J4473_04400 [Candidatus Aenigmarchaeota archaeon]|nr:hypothetical protein [Candidatus Aenigmarchaeota archaeon]
MYENELVKYGLTTNQSKVYIVLLKANESTASELSKRSSINRSTTYQELSGLIKLGLVSYIIKNSRRYYNASSPEKLIEILDTKKAEIERIIPDLKRIENSITKPFAHVEVYEGREGIKTFYQHILNTNPVEVIAFGVTGMAFEILKYSFPQFVKKYEIAGIKARYLANFDSKKWLRELPKKHVKIRYMPKEYCSGITTIIYSDFVAIQSLVKENMQVILIRDKILAAGYKKYFEFMWNSIS